MLFVTFMTPKPNSTVMERTGRRMEWIYPEGVRLIGEYWLAHRDPEVVVLTEADDAVKIIETVAQWEDLFDIEVVPAITVEAGLAATRKQFAAAVA